MPLALRALVNDRAFRPMSALRARARLRQVRGGVARLPAGGAGGLRPWAVRLTWGVLLSVATLVMGAFVFPYPRSRLGYEGIRSTRFVDRHGVLVFERRGPTGAFQQPVRLDAVAPAVVIATLSSEDAAFYSHPGVDPMAVGRALWLDARAGRMAYGGSTITQQLAKTLHPEPRTLAGKLREAWDAWRLELALDKEQILTQYLNRVYYGRLARGIEAAAFRYYGKSAQQLRLDEAALLSILPRAPSYYDPERHPERARERRAHVLRGLARRGWISTEEAEQAARAPFDFVEVSAQRQAPHPVDRALRAEGRDGLVDLTIDLELQRALEERVRLHLQEIERFGASQAGIVVIENATGDVLAMVGSRQYEDAAASGASNVTTSLRTPGSSLKPFVYALAVEDGAHPSSLVLDVPTHFRGYQPRNPRQTYQGAVPLREALGSSLNVPAVRTAALVGARRVARLLHDAGVESVDPGGDFGLAIALGGVSVPLVELADAYATLARGGVVLPHRLVRTAEPVSPKRVLREETAFLITDALADPAARRREFGFETPLELAFPVAAKTGTSQAYCDNVVVGYSPEVTVAAWVGNFDGTPMRGLLAMEGAGPLWREAMQRAMQGRSRRDFVVPEGVVRMEVCTADGLPARGDCPRRREYVAAWTLARPGAMLGQLEGRGTPDARSALRIVAPPDGAAFIIDPLLPRERQRIEFRAQLPDGPDQTLRWFLNGELLDEATVSETARWTLRPGRQRLRAEVVGDRKSFDEIEFEVEG